MYDYIDHGDIDSGNECNYCDLRQIKRECRRDMKISTAPLGDWVGVYRHPKTVDFRALSAEERKQYWIRSYMALTDHCVC